MKQKWATNLECERTTFYLTQTGHRIKLVILLGQTLNDKFHKICLTFSHLLRLGQIAHHNVDKVRETWSGMPVKQNMKLTIMILTECDTLPYCC
jgi:hypothetical protein